MDGFGRDVAFDFFLRVGARTRGADDKAPRPRGCRMVPVNDTAMCATTRMLERAKVLAATEPDHHHLFPACRFRQTREVAGERSVVPLQLGAQPSQGETL